MADAEQHHRGCHRCHAARRRAALHAGAFSLGISNRLLAPERPASMAGPAEGHSLECEHLAKLDDVFVGWTAVAFGVGGGQRAGGSVRVLDHQRRCPSASKETKRRIDEGQRNLGSVVESLGDCSLSLRERFPRKTSRVETPEPRENIEHPTSNTERRSERGFALPFVVRRWMFDVGCSSGSWKATFRFSACIGTMNHIGSPLPALSPQGGERVAEGRERGGSADASSVLPGLNGLFFSDAKQGLVAADEDLSLAFRRGRKKLLRQLVLSNGPEFRRRV